MCLVPDLIDVPVSFSQRRERRLESYVDLKRVSRSQELWSGVLTAVDKTHRLVN
jgi:hypothetical protein